MTDKALSLWDYANSPQPLIAGVAKVLRKESVFWDVLPIKPIAALNVKVVREGTMHDVGWRNIGEAHGSNKAGKPEEVTETAYSIGNSIVVDKVYVNDKSPRIYNPMTYQTTMTTKSIARNFTDKCINGLPEDLKNPVGLWHRVMNDCPSSQRISGASLDISPDATTLSANIQSMIDLLDSLLYAVTGSVMVNGESVYFLTNDTMLLRIQSIFRQSQIVTTTKDALGRVFVEYKGAKFVDMGTKYDDTTRIMTNVENANGAALTGGATTSIYAVRMGDEYLTGWQEYPLDVTPPELTDDKVTFRSVIDWVVGLAMTHPRSIARLYGIVAA